MFSRGMPISVPWMEDMSVSQDPSGMCGRPIVRKKREGLERTAVNKTLADIFGKGGVMGTDLLLHLLDIGLP
jgi:hypothetical protein